MAGRRTSNRLDLELDDAGIHIPTPLSDFNSDTMMVKLYGSKVGKNGPTGTYVWIEARVPRAQVAGLAHALWTVIDAEQIKINRMKNAMKREVAGQ